MPRYVQVLMWAVANNVPVNFGKLILQELFPKLGSNTDRNPANPRPYKCFFPRFLMLILRSTLPPDVYNSYDHSLDIESFQCKTKIFGFLAGRDKYVQEPVVLTNYMATFFPHELRQIPGVPALVAVYTPVEGVRNPAQVALPQAGTEVGNQPAIIPPPVPQVPNPNTSTTIPKPKRMKRRAQRYAVRVRGEGDTASDAANKDGSESDPTAMPQKKQKVETSEATVIPSGSSQQGPVQQMALKQALDSVSQQAASIEIGSSAGASAERIAPVLEPLVQGLTDFSLQHLSVTHSEVSSAMPISVSEGAEMHQLEGGFRVSVDSTINSPALMELDPLKDDQLLGEGPQLFGQDTTPVVEPNEAAAREVSLKEKSGEGEMSEKNSENPDSADPVSEKEKEKLSETPIPSIPVTVTPLGGDKVESSGVRSEGVGAAGELSLSDVMAFLKSTRADVLTSLSATYSLREQMAKQNDKIQAIEDKVTVKSADILGTLSGMETIQGTILETAANVYQTQGELSRSQGTVIEQTTEYRDAQREVEEMKQEMKEIQAQMKSIVMEQGATTHELKMVRDEQGLHTDLLFDLQKGLRAIHDRVFGIEAVAPHQFGDLQDPSTKGESSRRNKEAERRAELDAMAAGDMQGEQVYENIYEPYVPEDPDVTMVGSDSPHEDFTHIHSGFDVQYAEPVFQGCQTLDEYLEEKENDRLAEKAMKAKDMNELWRMDREQWKVLNARADEERRILRFESQQRFREAREAYLEYVRLKEGPKWDTAFTTWNSPTSPSYLDQEANDYLQRLQYKYRNMNDYRKAISWKITKMVVTSKGLTNPKIAISVGTERLFIVTREFFLGKSLIELFPMINKVPRTTELNELLRDELIALCMSQSPQIITNPHQVKFFEKESLKSVDLENLGGYGRGYLIRVAAVLVCSGPPSDDKLEAAAKIATHLKMTIDEIKRDANIVGVEHVQEHEETEEQLAKLGTLSELASMLRFENGDDIITYVEGDEVKFVQKKDVEHLDADFLLHVSQRVFARISREYNSDLQLLREVIARKKRMGDPALGETENVKANPDRVIYKGNPVKGVQQFYFSYIENSMNNVKLLKKMVQALDPPRSSLEERARDIIVARISWLTSGSRVAPQSSEARK